MNDNMASTLSGLGFSEKEARVYLALLRLGPCAALRLSRETGIDRTSLYDLLARLSSRGIVSAMAVNGAKRFRALEPQGLLNLQRERCASLQSILPSLQSLAPAGEPLRCEVFSGREGLLAVAKELVAARKNYIVIGHNKRYDDILGLYAQQAIARLNRWNVRERAIVGGKSGKKLKSGEYRFIDKKLLSNDVSTLVYGDTVLFFLWEEPYHAMRVRSKALAKAQREYFELLWRVAKP